MFIIKLYEWIGNVLGIILDGIAELFGFEHTECFIWRFIQFISTLWLFSFSYYLWITCREVVYPFNFTIQSRGELVGLILGIIFAMLLFIFNLLLTIPYILELFSDFGFSKLLVLIIIILGTKYINTLTFNRNFLIILTLLDVFILFKSEFIGHFLFWFKD